MHYYLYKVTNSLNNKIYIGVHKTKNLNDGYMGSGKHIKNSIKKYGVNNFKKEILKWFDSEEDMYAEEIKIVTEEFLQRDDVYNKKLGGPANFYYVNKEKLNHKVKQHLIHGERCKTDPIYREEFSKKMKLASEKNKEVRSKTMKEKNHNRDRFWISNDIEKKSIMIDEDSFKSMHNWYRGLKYRKPRKSTKEV